PVFSVPIAVVALQVDVEHRSRVTGPFGTLGFAPDVALPTVTVKVTNCLKFDGFGEEVRIVDEASEYCAVPVKEK
ncbi:MAG: hypothetical protein ABI298_03225, partial [Acidimicrobiales bacterium]